MMRFLVIGVVALCALTSVAEAQQSRSRRGVWFGLGAGAGSGKATCSICQDARGTGVAGQVRAGGTVSQSVLASVEVAGWRKNGPAVDRSFIMVTAVGTVYPARDLGLHLKAGLGGYWYQEEDAVTRLASQGIALKLGAGYDVPLSTGVGFTPFVTLITSGSGNPTRLDKATNFKQPLFSDLSVTVWQFGLALTIY